MKKVFISVGVLLVIVFMGFLYRYEIEKPKLNVPGSSNGNTTGGVACTDEAKICPDGSAVGRTGSNCAFAMCPPPNAEITSASTTLDFVLPSGYKRNVVISDESSYIGSYVFAVPTATSTDSENTIDIHNYEIPAGSTASQVMLAQTYFDPSGMTATSTNEFKSVTEGKNTFYEIVIGRFEGQVQIAYYLYEPSSVLRFDVTERGVKNWTDPNLNLNTLAQNMALRQMLATLQVSHQ